jgi:hypothetical protein
VCPWLDAEGRVVIFSSRQPVDPDDTTTDYDLFVRPIQRLAGPREAGPGAIVFSVPQ